MTAIENERGILRANTYLMNTFIERVLPRIKLVTKAYRLPKINEANASCYGRYNRLPDLSRADIDLLAEDIASFINVELGFVNDQIQGASDLKTLWLLYQRAAAITQQFRQLPPLWDRISNKYVCEDDVGPAISRMLSPKWWQSRLRRISAEWREHLQIALTNVSKTKTPYASRVAVSEWREQKNRTRDFLKSMELEDEDGNRISLIDKYDGSVANPAIRRCELMVRIRGFENICNELGFVGEFYTLTAPSKYHATTKHGHRNRKWNGASPAETQRYLRGVWERVRAKLHREDLRIFGIRVAEPHHDGTPHWHMLMFMQPEDVDRVREIMSDYAFEEDRGELKTPKARKARFHAEAIDPEKGSATGYVAKYISKNIDGYALDDELDDESQKPLKETAPAVSAWAARWRIRQFQFIGGAPVSVYRELRRMADQETAKGLSIEFAAVHDAADVGDWAGYINAQGGPFVRRDDLVVRTYYENAAELNEYGEETTRIKGVFSPSVGSDTPIITRSVQWKIVAKKAVDLAFDLRGDPSPPWSSVNNCTGGSGDRDPQPDVTEPIFIDFERITAKERRRLLRRVKAEPKERHKKQASGFAEGTVMDGDFKKSARVVERKAANRAMRIKKAAPAMEKITAELQIAGVDISAAEAWRISAGYPLRIGQSEFRGTADGEVFQIIPKRIARAEYLQRVIAERGHSHTKLKRQAQLIRHLKKCEEKEPEDHEAGVSDERRADVAVKNILKWKKMIKGSAK
ncbi:replication protein [Ewingella americana]|nr:replication protein [Ewingella americana]